jgi:hypothetical protein
LVRKRASASEITAVIDLITRVLSETTAVIDLITRVVSERTAVIDLITRVVSEITAVIVWGEWIFSRKNCFLFKILGLLCGCPRIMLAPLNLPSHTTFLAMP